MAKTDLKTQGENARSTLTMDGLIDDCLLPVLARVPLHDQFTSLPLTCKRWYALLPAVHLKRTSLVFWGDANKQLFTQLPYLFMKSFNRFHPTSPVSTERYVAYAVNLLNATKYEETSSQADYHYLQSLDIEACTQIREHFPNLKHLSLVNVDMSLETLLALLGHFPTQLESLFLREPGAEPSLDPISLQSEKDVLIGQILTLINGMPLLRQLGLILDRAFLPNLSHTLSSVLPRLQELSLSNGHLDVYPILLRLDDSKLRRLTLECAGWPHLQMFSHLLAAKPGFRGLTHLSLYGYQDLSKDSYPTRDIPLSVVERICVHFPLLEHLNIHVKDTLRDLLPHLCKLKNLLHLAIRSHFTEILYGLLDGRRRSSEQLLSQCGGGIPSLQVLIIQRPVIFRYGRMVATEKDFTQMSMENYAEHPESLPLLRQLFPQLRQLYLPSYLMCPCLEQVNIIFLPSDRPAGCTCKARIINCLNSFEHIPQIEVPNSVPKCREELN